MSYCIYCHIFIKLVPCYCNKIHNWVGPSEKGAYGFSDVMRANAVYDVIYDVSLQNVYR